LIIYFLDDVVFNDPGEYENFGLGGQDVSIQGKSAHFLALNLL
jgi:hypothetical protein